jgi:thermitase
MATPQVSGLLGLMKSIRPNLTAKEAYQILNDTGKATKNPAETGRLIQPYQAVARLVGELQ